MASLLLQGKVRGKVVRILVDTGAQVSLIFLPQSGNKELQPPRCRLTGIGSGVVNPVGSCLVEFTIDSVHYKFRMEVLNRNHSQYDIILGDDFLRKFQGIINYRTETIQFGGHEHRFAHASHDNSVERLCATGGIRPNSTDRTAVESPLKANTTLELPAGTGKVFWIRTTIKRHGNATFLIDPLRQNEVLDRMQVHVRRSLCYPSKHNCRDSMPVAIDNFGTTDATIPRGTVLASLTMLGPEDTPPTVNISDKRCQSLPTRCVNLNSSLYSVFRDKLQHLPHDEQTLLCSVLAEYEWLFAERDYLPATDLVQHEIPTGDARPIKQKPYRIPYHLQPVVEETIRQQLAAGIIQPSSSAWASPIVLVKKKSLNGETNYRMCVDMRAVNRVTTPDHYPLPRIDETIDRLGNCKFFSTLDLKSGYHQIPIAPKDRHKTAFIVPDGLYEFLRMPFGLRNAPATFQRFADLLLRGLKPTVCLVYLDDIIIFSKNIDEHAEHLRSVFSKLQDANLSLKIEKCHFAQAEVKYLGHIIGRSGVKPDPQLTEAIRTFPTPQTVKQLQSYLGIANYYRKYCSNYAEITKPLTRLLKKDTPFVWSDDCEVSFQKVKEMLTNAPVLSYPDFSKPFILSCDASNYALGCVLSQEIDGVEKPIGYASRQLNNAEINYSTTEKECLALLFGIKYFRCYLYGRRFTVYTDHSALQWLLNLKDSSSKLMRWALLLSEYDYEVRHKPGKLNQNADALSRKIRIIRADDVLIDELKAAQEEDVTCQNYKDDPKFVMQGGVLYRITKHGERAVIPASLQERIIKQCHDSLQACHHGKNATNVRVASRYWWKTRRRDVNSYVHRCLPCAQRAQPVRSRVPLQSLPQASKPFDYVSMDIVGPLPQSRHGNKYILSIIDQFSRYLILIPMADMTAETVAKHVVEKLVLPFGSPECILTDQATNFMSALFSQVCKLLNVRKWRTSPFHPQANGRVERVHKTIMKMVSYYVNRSHTDWCSYISYIASAYNTRIHEATGFTPYEAVFGRPMNSPFEIDKLPPGVNLPEIKRLAHRLKTIWRKVKSNNIKSTAKQLRRRNKNAVVPSFQSGDCVLLRNTAIKPGRAKKFSPNYEGPYKILRLTSPVNAEIQLPDRKLVVHFDRLRPYQGNATDSQPAPPQVQAKPSSVKRKKKQTPPAPPATHRYGLRSGHKYALRSRD